MMMAHHHSEIKDTKALVAVEANLEISVPMFPKA